MTAMMHKDLHIFRIVNFKAQLGKTMEFNFLEHSPVWGDGDGRLSRTTILERPIVILRERCKDEREAYLLPISPSSPPAALPTTTSTIITSSASPLGTTSGVASTASATSPASIKWPAATHGARLVVHERETGLVFGMEVSKRARSTTAKRRLAIASSTTSLATTTDLGR